MLMRDIYDCVPITELAKPEELMAGRESLCAEGRSKVSTRIA